MSRSRLGLGAAAVAALAIGAPSSLSAMATARPLPQGAPLEIDGAPRLSVGLASGDPSHELSGVRTPFLLADGRLVVPLADANSLRLFGADGAFLEQLGGTGRGSGEFLQLESAWASGDVIEAADRQLRRVTRFAPDGSVEVVQLVGAPRYAQSILAGSAANGWVTGGVWETVMEPGRATIVILRVSPDGRSFEELARVEGMERTFVETSEGNVSGPHPLTPRAVIRVSGGEIYVAETLTPRIRVFDPSGNQLREITWSPSNDLDPSTALQLVREAASTTPPVGTREEIRQITLSVARVPDQLSVFWDFMVDEAGFVWVRPYDPAVHAEVFGGLGEGSYLTSPMGQGGEWRVFSSEGVEVGSVEVPVGLRLTQITLDAIVGITVDAAGRESVHVHALRRR